MVASIVHVYGNEAVEKAFYDAVLIDRFKVHPLDDSVAFIRLKPPRRRVPSIMDWVLVLKSFPPAALALRHISQSQNRAGHPSAAAVGQRRRGGDFDSCGSQHRGTAGETFYSFEAAWKP